MAGKNTYNEAQPRPRIFLPPACGTRHKNTQQYLCSVENVLDQRGLAPKKIQTRDPRFCSKHATIWFFGNMKKYIQSEPWCLCISARRV